MGMPRRKRIKQTILVNVALCGLKTSDQLSTTPVIKDSTKQNALSIPRVCNNRLLFLLTFRLMISYQ